MKYKHFDNKTGRFLWDAELWLVSCLFL